MKVTGQWKWDNTLNRHIFYSEDGKRYGTTYQRTDFSVKSINVRPPHDDGTIQGKLELLLDGMEA